jgi:hypothetical protein
MVMFSNERFDERNVFKGVAVTLATEAVCSKNLEGTCFDVKRTI